MLENLPPRNSVVPDSANADTKPAASTLVDGVPRSAPVVASTAAKPRLEVPDAVVKLPPMRTVLSATARVFPARMACEALSCGFQARRAPVPVLKAAPPPRAWPSTVEKSPTT
jgi:hypothetical protein